MRNHETSKNTISHLDKFDFPEAGELALYELAELWSYVITHAAQPKDYRMATLDTAFKYGFICGARWQKRNPAATVTRHDGKAQE